MNKDKFAEVTLETLCAYVGDDKVFEALINRWGIEEVYNVVAKLVEAQQTLEEEVEEEIEEEMEPVPIEDDDELAE